MLTPTPARYSRFIILNGPAGVGKTIIVRELCRVLLAHNLLAHQDSFAAPIRHFIATAIGEKYNDMPKDSPVAILRGRSVREAVIGISSYMKDAYGEDIFGRLLYNRAMRLDPKPHYIIADSANDEDEVGALQSHLLIHVERDGHDFHNDSRKYLPSPDYTLINDGGLSTLIVKAERLALWIMEQGR